MEPAYFPFYSFNRVDHYPLHDLDHAPSQLYDDVSKNKKSITSDLIDQRVDGILLLNFLHPQTLHEKPGSVFQG